MMHLLPWAATLQIIALILYTAEFVTHFGHCQNADFEFNEENEADSAAGGSSQFDVYFTCEGIVDWRVEKICKYMHQADDYIRNHPPVAPPMPGTFIEEEQQQEGAGGQAAAGTAGEVPAAPASVGTAAAAAASGAEVPSGYGEEQQDGTAAGGVAPASSFANKNVTKKMVPFNPLDCISLECLCHYMTDDKCSSQKPLKKVIRKEYRLLTDEERKRFHSAINQVKANGQYDNLVITHMRFSNESAGAHFGPAFLPWHREYNKRMEFAMRMIDPDVALPFWDSTIEDALPRPNDSMLFTDELMGSTDADGLVLGDFKHWNTAGGDGKRLKRLVGHFTADPKNASAGVGKPLSEVDITHAMQGIDFFLAYSTPVNECIPLVQAGKRYNSSGITFDLGQVLEYPHNYVHQFIGGHMGDTPLSSNDPIFFLHHPFVDNLWEMFRQKYQSRSQRESSYPRDDQGCSNKYHFRDQHMLPFFWMDEPEKVRAIRNVDCLSNNFTDNLYEYGPRPSCSMGPDCGSKYLFCDTSNGTSRCVAKIKIGGICKGFENANICYQGQCQNGFCIWNGAMPTGQIAAVQPSAAAVSFETGSNSVQLSTSSTSSSSPSPPPPPPSTASPSLSSSSPAAFPPPSSSSSARLPPPSIPSPSFMPPSNSNNNNRVTVNYVDDPIASVLLLSSSSSSSSSAAKAQQQPAAISQPAPESTRKNNQHQPQQLHQCFNHYECCGLWATEGQCQRNPAFMQNGCKASCRICVPNYNLNIECADRMSSCASLVAAGDCQKNWRFMKENCRQSCGGCSQTRAQNCAIYSTAAHRARVGNRGKSYYRKKFIAVKIQKFMMKR